ncbi:putative methyltransferase-domain-containing protein [Stachybotrys elegans]|uniref:Methyltransferase-domain-containing protein n=1 Tax=Stachybotrys elegans TaxID=80388 RepID=A0A8K0SXU6_9HYPO|nr:putative methyltransferase-domain-containing protein [Stachybotrys elegans]
MAAWKSQVERFCHEYLQLEPSLDFPDDAYLREAEVQDTIFGTIFAEGAVRYSPPPRYRLRVLKQLVARIEASISDWDQHAVSDDLMVALSVLLATPIPPETDSAQQKCYVTYHLSALPRAQPAQPCVTLLENRFLISAAGTTGLRTWEAAMHLGQYLCRHPSIVSGRHVLELGAGTGYLSILCTKHLDAAHVIASDGSDDVINNLPDNFFLNGLQDSPRVVPMDVKWGYALMGTEDEAWNGGRPVDVVLGADITYDDSVIPALVGTLLDVFALHPRVEVYISATQRNIKTFQVFLDKCRLNHLDVEDMRFEVPPRESQDGPFYNDQVAIRICRVCRSQEHGG